LTSGIGILYNVKAVKNNRIDCIINEIKTTGTVVDVGSDHAQLAIKLLKAKRATHVFNIELNKKPYLITIDNLSKNKLLNKTTNIFANGLQTTLINLKIDYCVIAGMGSKNIIDILTQKNKLIKIDFFILVPNNYPDKLRNYLKQQHYRIKYEKIIQERNYYYSLIVCSKKTGLLIKNSREIYFGPYNLKHPTIEFQQMYQKRKKYIESNKLHLHNPLINKELKLLKENKI
jgi:tRNA (adenine22-N1)-methyltransferase